MSEPAVGRREGHPNQSFHENTHRMNWINFKKEQMNILTVVLKSLNVYANLACEIKYK